MKVGGSFYFFRKHLDYPLTTKTKLISMIFANKQVLYIFARLIDILTINH